MSDIPQGPDWWRASNGLYYPPETRPGTGPTDPASLSGEPGDEHLPTPPDQDAETVEPVAVDPDATQVVAQVPPDDETVHGEWTETWVDGDADDEPRSGRPGWLIPVIVAVLVLAVAAALLLWLLAGDDDDGDTTTDTTTSTTTDDDETTEPEDTTTTTEDDGSVSVFEIGIGDCFDTDEVDSGDGLVVTTVMLVECDGPHRAEVFGIEMLDTALDEPFPGSEARDAAAQELCEPGFEEFVGTPLAESELVLLWLAPTEESWADEDREVACAVAAAGDEPLTGSAAGSGL